MVTETTAPNLADPDNVSLAAMFIALGRTGRAVGAAGARTAVVLLLVAAAIVPLPARRARFRKASRARCF